MSNGSDSGLLGGLDTQQIQAMMAQFGATEKERNDANKQALFALGFGLLGGRKGNELQTIGRAGLGAMDYRNRTLADIPQQKAQQFNAATQMLKLQQAQQAQQGQQVQQERLAGIFGGGGGPNLAAMGPGGPTSQNAVAIAPPSQIEKYRLAAMELAASGRVEDAKRLNDIANSMEAKYSTTPQLYKDPSGRIVRQLIGERGETKDLPGGPAEKLHFAGTGGMAGVGLDPYTGAQASRGLPATMSPGEVAADARARAAQAQAERHFQAGQGRPTWDAASGQFVYPPGQGGPTGTAVTPTGFAKAEKPLTEFQSKSTAFLNQMEDASRNIKKLEEKGFGGKGMYQQSEIVRAGSEGIPYVPGSAAITRATVSDEAQKFQQSELQWTEAALRFMTGANAPEPEVRRNADTYFPRPGDSEARIAQKETSRKNMEESIRIAAGPGASKVSEKPAAGTVVDTLPDPASVPKGTRVRDTKTGKIMVSNGTRWE